MHKPAPTIPFRFIAAISYVALLGPACQRAPERSAADVQRIGTLESAVEAGPAGPLPASPEAAVGVPPAASLSVAPKPTSAPPPPSPREAKAQAVDAARALRHATGAAARRKAPAGAVLQGSAPDTGAEAYASIPETGFASVADSPLSTFSIDVDTASYANVRRFLRQGQLPPPGAVRLEELVNYFPYAYADPVGKEPFSVTTEVSTAPWNPEHRLLHIGLQGQRVPTAELPARNLVFLLDVSGSMESPNKLPLLKRSLSALTETLGERDRVAIVVYAGASGLVLPATPGDRTAQISAALDRLEAGGSTNGGAGLDLAYSVAERLVRPGSSTRVILATDGDFNVGPASEDALVRLIESKRESGVFLSVLGFGMGNYKDSTLELLADKGNGNYAYVDSLAEARKVLVSEGGATLVTLAQDVKLQVEFNPEQVAAYRLLGYENRRLAAADFNDDTKDAGELGAGHRVTALYELIPPGKAVPRAPVDALRYQSTPEPLGAHGSELCTIKIRYEAPGAERSQKLEHPVVDARVALQQTSNAFRFAAAVATFGMVLRRSPERGDASYELARELAVGARGQDLEGYQSEFISLVDTAAALERGSDRPRPLAMP